MRRKKLSPDANFYARQLASGTLLVVDRSQMLLFFFEMSDKLVVRVVNALDEFSGDGLLMRVAAVAVGVIAFDEALASSSDICHWCAVGKLEVGIETDELRVVGGGGWLNACLLLFGPLHFSLLLVLLPWQWSERTELCS